MEVFLKSVVCFILPFLSVCEKTKVGIPVKYANCGPDTILGVDFTPCSTQPTCKFERGTNVTVTINFKTLKEAAKVQTKVYGIVGGVPVPYDTPPDGCTGCNLNCPLAAGGNFTYINVFPVLKEYPSIKLKVKWELLDENNDYIVCFLFPLEID